MVFLKRVCEEALRQVFCVFVVGVPLQPDVLVDWLPVARENRFEPALADNLVRAARAYDRRLICFGEAMQRTADIRVWINIQDWTKPQTASGVFSRRTHCEGRRVMGLNRLRKVANPKPCTASH